jgi:hypothetical protein
VSETCSSCTRSFHQPLPREWFTLPDVILEGHVTECGQFIPAASEKIAYDSKRESVLV